MRATYLLGNGKKPYEPLVKPSEAERLPLATVSLLRILQNLFVAFKSMNDDAMTIHLMVAFAEVRANVCGLPLAVLPGFPLTPAATM